MMDLSLKPFTVEDKVPSVPCVYSFVNTKTGDCYIGSTKDFKDRKRQHVQMVLKGNHESRLVQESWNLHSKHFIFILIQVEPDVEKRLDLEQYYIDNVQSTLNICRISRSVKGRTYTEATLEKMSKAQTGRKASAETLAKLRLVQSNRPKEQYEKGAAKRRGMKRSVETKNKLSELAKLRTLNEDPSVKEKRLAAIARANKGRKQSDSEKNNRAASLSSNINQYDLNGVFIREWPSSTIAAKELGVSKSSITACVRHNEPIAHGSIWRRVDDPSEIIPYVNTTLKPVHQMDLNGNVIQTFDSIKAAAEYMGCKQYMISNSLSKKSGSALGFIWRRKTY